MNQESLGDRPDKRYLPVSALDATRRTMVVKDLFASASPTYDRLNHLLSFRRDVAWRREVVRRMRFFSTHAFLDVATGTGDLAVEAARRFPAITVKGVDFVEEMLVVGRQKIDAQGLGDRISLEYGDALALPFPGATFDVSAIAFGMRNIPDSPRALREMARVTVPGGQVMVLEFTFAPARGFRWLYGFYLRNILPRFARLVVRDTSAYHYLADSILAYPHPDAFDSLMVQAGLVQVQHFALTLGTVYLHVGCTPRSEGGEG
jgi:demethylmenaquinone methyltransferase/2-methoxy-6-polyprenyl-1,4-benzoquinol methylase